MKYLLIFLFFPMVAVAQVIDQQQISAERYRIETLLRNEASLDSLTSLAIQNSYYVKSFEQEVAQQYENKKQEKNKWYSTFRVGINFFSLNTTLVNQESVTTAGLLPNLGLTLGIDPEKFINRRSYVREAHQNIIRAENQLKHQRRQVRQEVLALFYQYLEALGILELRYEANQNQKDHTVLLEAKFKKGESRLEDLLLSQSALILTEEALVKSQLQVQKIRQMITLITSATEGDTTNHSTY